MKFSILTLLVLALAVKASAAGNVLFETPTDPRSVAMGDAGVALGSGLLISDANPALAGFATTTRLEFLAPVSKGFDEESSLWQIGVLSPAQRGRFYTPATAIIYREYVWATRFRTAFDPENLQIVETKTRLLSFVLAAPIKGRISLGAAVRRADIDGITGWYTDLGASVRHELYSSDGIAVRGSIAVAGRRLGNDIEDQFVGSFRKADIFETVRTVAANVNPEIAWGATLGASAGDVHATAALQVVDPMRSGTGGDLYEHAGFELAYRDWGALRIGYLNDEDFVDEITYGAGARVPVAERWAVGIDYAREPALPLPTALDGTNAPEASHFISLRVEYDRRQR